MSRPLTRAEALDVLELPSSAGPVAAKRAYRRLARRHHPDVGGDPATFHRLRLAFERLAEDGGAAPYPRVARGRPSRPGAAWRGEEAVADAAVDLSSVDWDQPAATPGAPLTRDGAAVHLAGGEDGLLRELSATSRAPRSRMNRLAGSLSPDLTAHLLVRSGRDDRGREVVLLEVAGAHRRARRALDRVGLDERWRRQRGPSTTVLRSSLVPSPQRRATAVRAVERLEALLERLDWPLPTWTATR